MLILLKKGSKVSIAVYALPLKQVNDLKIEQTILPTQQKESFPFVCQLESNQLLLDSKLQVATIDNLTPQTDLPMRSTKGISKANTLELIVFSQLTINLLVKLLTQSQLNLHALNKINHRNNAISYRFNVTSADVNASRQQVAQFSVSNNLEVALIDNAPKLSTPGVLVMDMDSTTIEIECIDEIAVLAGVGEQVSAVTELAMQGELDFAQSLHQRVATLANAPETILEEVAKDIPLMAGLTTLIEHLKRHHWKVAIASGGFTYFADHLQQLLGLDAVFANQLEIIDGKLTGKVLGNVVDAQAKADSLALLSAQFNIAQDQTLAMGDGANDLLMMSAANLGIAFHAKPIVLTQADSSINHEGLDCALHWLA
jgi:phosphoserine phosphatase